LGSKIDIQSDVPTTVQRLNPTGGFDFDFCSEVKPSVVKC